MFLTVPSGTATSTEKSELYRAPSECSPDHFVNCGHHAGVARILLLRGAIGKTRSQPGSGEARGSPSRKSGGEYRTSPRQAIAAGTTTHSRAIRPRAALGRRGYLQPEVC